MNEGEHWMISGDNGVGKSTLLKLILGELWPAQGGSIKRFSRDPSSPRSSVPAPRERSRGSKDASRNAGQDPGGRGDFKNVWEIKKRIGYVSADFQARYFVDLTTEQVIATGFSASVGWLQRTTKAQDKRVQDMITLFDLRPLAKRSILQMSYGQARKVLVARALVASPRVVILDEVFDGLDAHFRAELAAILQDISHRTGLIFVSHHEAECLPCITHRLCIEKGRIIAQEQRLG
jgi:ABC-type molybdenum transport system ATPase subunit/photorepair protein PhrA